MTVTPRALSRAAGLSAAASGLLYGLVQVVHPAETLAAVQTTTWAGVHLATLAMAVLGLVGVTGLYLRQVRESGVAGLVGYLLLGAFYLLVTSFTFVEAFVLPEMATSAPRLVEDLLGIFSGGSTGTLGAVTAAGPTAFVLYLLGALTFGVALSRTRILARWAAVLLAVGAVLTLVVPLLPHAVGRGVAVPFAVGLVGLGVSLWRDPQAAIAGTDPTPAPIPDPVPAPGPDPGPDPATSTRHAAVR